MGRAAEWRPWAGAQPRSRCPALSSRNASCGGDYSHPGAARIGLFPGILLCRNSAASGPIEECPISRSARMCAVANLPLSRHNYAPECRHKSLCAVYLCPLLPARSAPAIARARQPAEGCGQRLDIQWINCQLIVGCARRILLVLDKNSVQDKYHQLRSIACCGSMRHHALLRQAKPDLQLEAATPCASGEMVPNQSTFRFCQLKSTKSVHINPLHFHIARNLSRFRRAFLGLS